MITTDRTPIILACVDDLLREHEGADDVDRLTVALQISFDARAVARLWPPTEDDQAIAAWIVECARGREPADHQRFEPEALADLSMVAAHLATVAASLLVRGEAWADEARTLWRAASRLLGHDASTKDASTEPRASDESRAAVVDDASRLNDWHRWARLCHGADADRDDIGMRAHVDQLVFGAFKLKRELDDWRRWVVKKTGADPNGGDSFLRTAVDVNATAEVKRLAREHAEEVARLTERLATTTADLDEALRLRDDARADLEEAQRSLVSAGPVKQDVQSAAASSTRESYREVALRAGAKDCTVFVGPGDSDLTVVVELRDGALLGDIRIALESVMPGTHYKLRRVGRPGDRCGHRSDGDPAACDHCSLKG